MGQPAEHGAAGKGSRPVRRIRRCRNGNVQRLMRTSLVVVAYELAEHMPQVPFVHDDDMVETFPAESPDEPLSDPVRLRSSDRRQYGLDADSPRVFHKA